MKCFCLILLLAAGALAARAQTNAPDVFIRIHSDSGTYDFIHRRPVYLGHVRVNHPSMKLTCDWLAADLPNTNRPDTFILAKTNVVIDLIGGKGRTTNGTPGMTDDQGQNWHVTSDQAVYLKHLQGAVTNETVTASGHAIAKSDKMTITGEPLVYDLVTKQFSSTDYDTVYKSNAFAPAKANAAAGQTNPVAAPH